MNIDLTGDARARIGPKARLCVLGLGMCAALSLALPAAAAEPVPVKPISISKDLLAGKGLAAIPPYKKEVTVSGLQKMAAGEAFCGPFSVMVLEIIDGGAMKLDNYPFDQYVQVLAGSTTLIGKDGSRQTFTVGDHFVLPKGFTGVWELDKGFRELTILDADQLKAGLAQFEP